MSVVPQDQWESYSYQTDEGLVVVTFHTEASEIDKSQFPFCARVLITIKNPNQNGGPTREEAEVLWAMEDRLVEALDARQVPCMLLGRLTHAGTRELVFQVADYTPFRPPVGRWMQEHGNYETDVSEHDGWDFYFESVWPSETSWLFIQDRRVVENLIKAGSDASKIHSIEFVFQGDALQLRALQTELEERDYRLVKFSSEEQQLVMAASMVPDLQAIFQESLAHQNACRRLGLEYDGWGTAVVS